MIQVPSWLRPLVDLFAPEEPAGVNGRGGPQAGPKNLQVPLAQPGQYGRVQGSRPEQGGAPAGATVRLGPGLQLPDEAWVRSLEAQRREPGTTFAHSRLNGVSVAVGVFDIFGLEGVDAVMIPQEPSQPHGFLSRTARARGARIPEEDTPWDAPKSFGDAWWAKVDGDARLKMVANLICMHGKSPGSIHQTVLSALKQAAEHNRIAAEGDRIRGISIPGIGTGMSGDASDEGSARAILRAVSDFGAWAKTNGLGDELLPRVVVGLMDDERAYTFAETLQNGTHAFFVTNRAEALRDFSDRVWVSAQEPFAIDADAFIIPMPAPDPKRRGDPTHALLSAAIAEDKARDGVLATWHDAADQIMRDYGGVVGMWGGTVQACGLELNDPGELRWVVSQALKESRAKRSVVLPAMGSEAMEPKERARAIALGVLDYVAAGGEAHVRLTAEAGSPVRSALEELCRAPDRWLGADEPPARPPRAAS